MPRLDGGKRMAFTYALLFFAVLLMYQNCARRASPSEEPKNVTKLGGSIVDVLAEGPLMDKQAVCETEGNYVCIRNISGPGLHFQQLNYNTCAKVTFDAEKTWCVDILVFQQTAEKSVEEFRCFNHVLKEGENRRGEATAPDLSTSLTDAVKTCRALLRY